MPHGYFGWTAAYSPGESKPEDIFSVRVNDYFPACRLMLLEYRKDRDYLEIKHGQRSISLEDIESDYIFIGFYNELCSTCIEEIKIYKAFYHRLLADGDLKTKIKMIGIGAGSKKRHVAKFRKQKEIPFPLFADENWEIFDCLGRPGLPVSYLVQRRGERRFIRLIQSGHIGNTELLLAKVKSTIAVRKNEQANPQKMGRGL
jgi:peroxiredoxin